jgi:hypothetical protein
MDETLGSGFDNIRAAVMSPTSFSARMNVSPVSVHAVTSLGRPSFISLAGVPGPFSTVTDSLYSQSNILSRQSGSAPVDPSESSSDHSTSFSEETYINSLDARFSESFTGSEQPTTPLTSSTQHLTRHIEINKYVESESLAHSQYDVIDQEVSSLQSGSDGYESDPDDTRKFYTELESYLAIGDNDYDTDDSDYYDTDSEYEPSNTGQMLTSISRYDHRFHRYWHAEQSELAENQFDTALQTSKSILYL